ncbi:MAG: hypothetical protein LBP73_10305, partial [Clostridiales Family XIII bacterium]|nr:hypothetical protein [Clostridiales Family XIII bacterium]
MHTYKEFLAGSLTIDDANMEEIFFEGGDFSKFTLFDINWDSMPELHIRTPRYYGIFTYANDETRMIHDGSAYDDLLEDGTLLYTKIDDTPPHVAYRHKRFNTDGNLAEDIAFDQWDRDGNGEYDGKDVYCFDGRAVSFEQWVDLTGWRLSLDSNMKWMDYS